MADQPLKADWLEGLIGGSFGKGISAYYYTSSIPLVWRTKDQSKERRWQANH